MIDVLEARLVLILEVRWHHTLGLRMRRRRRRSRSQVFRTGCIIIIIIIGCAFSSKIGRAFMFMRWPPLNRKNIYRQYGPGLSESHKVQEWNGNRETHILISTESLTNVA